MDSNGKSFLAVGSLVPCEFIYARTKGIQVQNAAQGSFQAQSGHRDPAWNQSLNLLQKDFMGSSCIQFGACYSHCPSYPRQHCSSMN